MITCGFSGIDVVPAQRCACTKCWRLVDVKNVGQSLQVPREDAQEEFCRKLRADCRVVNFCSLAHKGLVHKDGNDPKTGWTCCYGPRTSSHFVWGYEGAGTMECSSHAAATVHRRTMTFVELCRVPARTVPCTFRLLVHHNMLAKKKHVIFDCKKLKSNIDSKIDRNLK